MRPDPRTVFLSASNSSISTMMWPREKGGTIVFLAGEPGSGASETLADLGEALRSEKSKPFVVSYTFAGDQYVSNTQRARSIHSGWAPSVNCWPAPLFTDPLTGPFPWVLRSIADNPGRWCGMPSVQWPKRIFADGNSALLLKKCLRQAAERRPTVCLFDRIDQASAHLLTSLLLASAGELTQERPLYIVATLDEPQFREIARKASRRP